MSVVKSDVEKAKEYREKIIGLLAPVCELLTQAKKSDNFDINFVLGANADGVVAPQNLKITKSVEL